MKKATLVGKENVVGREYTIIRCVCGDLCRFPSYAWSRKGSLSCKSCGAEIEPSLTAYVQEDREGW